MNTTLARKRTLTDKQAAVLAFIEQHKPTPTFRQIADHFGWKSLSAAEHHVASLIRKGRLALNWRVITPPQTECYVVGRSVPEGGYDLEGCPQFECIGEALADLIERTTEADAAGWPVWFLVLLRCKLDGEHNTVQCDPLGAGEIVLQLSLCGRLK